MAKQGVGVSVSRKEDDRFLRGRGEYVGDIRLAGMRDVAFVRSPLAHARIKDIRIPSHLRDSVFIASDLAADTRPIRAVSGLPGFKPSDQPILAFEKVRQVGELIAMCVADTRAEAEDIAAAVEVDFEELPAVHDMLLARRPDAALVHEEWGDNVFLETFVDINMEAAYDAPVKITREVSTARQSMAPMEGRGTVAVWHKRMDQLVLYTGNQQPHIVRNGLSECLKLDQLKGPYRLTGCRRRVRLQGHRADGRCLSWVAGDALRLSRALDRSRREHLTAGANCREHHYNITVYADRDGTLRGVECEAGHSGAYSSYPFSACLEAAQVASILPDLRLPSYRCRTWSDRPTSARSFRTAALRARGLLRD